MSNTNPNLSNLKPFTGRDDPRNGRKPKGAKHLSTWIQEMMNDESFEANLLDAKKGIIEYKGAPIKAIIQVVLVKAVNGDPKAWDWLGKYGFGTKLELANNPDNPITGTLDPTLAADFAAYMKNKTKE